MQVSNPNNGKINNLSAGKSLPEKVATTNLLKDNRFSAVAQNPDFQIDTESVEYCLLNPVVSKLDKAKKKKLAKEESQFKEVEEESPRQKRKQVKEKKASRPRFFEVKEGHEFKSLHDKQDNKSELRKSLAERLEDRKDTTVIREHLGSIGNKAMTFSWKKSTKEDQIDQETRQHHMERKKIRRSAGEITKTFKSNTKFWRGKRGK